MTNATEPLDNYLFEFERLQENEKTKKSNQINFKKEQISQKLTNSSSSITEGQTSSNASTSAFKQSKGVSNNASSKLPSVNKPSLKQEIKCHKKFSIGSYAHMLNEPVEPPVKDINATAAYSNHKESLYESDDLSEEQIIDDYYQNLQQKNPHIKLKSKSNAAPTKPLSETQNKQIISETNVVLDKIAAKINSTGQQKWKNSTMPTKTSMFAIYS
jgi:hypothetical protein